MMRPHHQDRRQFIAMFSCALAGLSSRFEAAQPASGGVIDVHHHILPPEYVRAVGRAAIGRPSPNGRVPEWDVAASLRVMDAQGVDAAIVSISAPGIQLNDRALAARMARFCNEFAAQMVADHPQRFGFFTTLPLPDIDASLTVLQDAYDRLHCDGVELLTNYGNDYLGAPLFTPVLEELNRCAATVHVHPMTCDCDLNVLPGVPASMIEFPHGTTRTVASLLFAGAFQRYSRIKFIFSHAGGTLPVLVNRITAIATAERRPVDPSIMKRLYFDTAGPTPAVPTLAALTRFVSSKQIVFGSDFPFGVSAVKSILDNLREFGLSQAELQDIERGNATALFPRLAR